MTGVAALQLDGARTIPWTAKLPEGLSPVEVVFGQDDTGVVGEVQIAVATAGSRPTKALMDAAWKSRSANTAMPVLVVAVEGDSAWVYPGSGDVLGPASVGSVARQLQSVLDEPNVMAAQARLNTVERALTSGEAAGFSNQFLFASYHLGSTCLVVPTGPQRTPRQVRCCPSRAESSSLRWASPLTR